MMLHMIVNVVIVLSPQTPTYAWFIPSKYIHPSLIIATNVDIYPDPKTNDLYRVAQWSHIHMPWKWLNHYHCRNRPICYH